jgi:hypothetical protein
MNLFNGEHEMVAEILRDMIQDGELKVARIDENEGPVLLPGDELE